MLFSPPISLTTIPSIFAGIFTSVAVPLYFVILISLLSVYAYSKSSGEASGISTGLDEEELDELVGFELDELAGFELDELAGFELDELAGLEDDELEELTGFEEELEDELDDELADDDELDDELVEELDDDELDELEVDELSVLLDFSEVLDELTELLGVSEGVEVFAPSLHAVNVGSIAAAETALKIFLIFMPFFLSINKKVRSRSHAPKNAKLRLLRHNFR